MRRGRRLAAVRPGISRAPRATGKEILAALARDGWKLAKVRGSHHYLVKGSRKATVPVHAGEIVRPKLLYYILDQAGLSMDDLIALLNQ